MIVREPNGEPKLMVILSMAGLGEASRGAPERRIRPRAIPRRPVPGREIPGAGWSRLGPVAKAAETSAASGQAGVEDCVG